MEKNIDVTLTLNGDDIMVEFFEPESGDSIKMNFAFMSERHPEFNEMVGNELYSWITLMADEQKEYNKMKG